MKIELFGLPGSGKSTLAKKLKEQNYVFPKRSLFYFIIRHFCVCFFWVKEVIKETLKTKTYSLWRFKLAIVFDTFARIGYAEINKRQNIIIDEGLFQRIFTVYEHNLNPSQIKKIFNHIIWPEKIIIVDSAQNLFKRYSDQDNPRVKLGEKYLQNWFLVLQHNYSVILDVLKMTSGNKFYFKDGGLEDLLYFLQKKNILIITQAVNLTNPILGFFHGWIRQIVKYYNQVTVICLEKGKNTLPEDVKILSLGKELGFSRFKYILNFYKYIWQERRRYDLVLVHMNQEYIILGGLFWKCWSKKVLLWRNHPRGNLLTKLAILLSHKVFCTSPFSFTAKFIKTQLMPVGIDTDFFIKKNEVEKKNNSILFLSRISPIKKPELLVESLFLLKKKGLFFSSLFVGDPVSSDEDFYNDLKNQVKNYNLDDFVKFIGGVKNNETVDLYNQFQIFVNLTPTGSLDKTIFEAMSCQTLILTSNKSLLGKIDNQLIFEEGNVNDLAAKLQLLLNLSEQRKKQLGEELRNYVIKEHSLNLLIKKIAQVSYE
ncbi:MAG TPA: glycosyltransferase [Candidatus Magasanikbacteria bacterium]|nr:glycosyltransferase [Candidatus Magasanikbacteria bacterium]